MIFNLASSKIIIFLAFLLFLFGCSAEESKVKYDAEKLIEQKCAQCHNLDMPPTLSKDELAPPMMAVSFHVHSFVKPTDESQRVNKAVEFVVDYVRNPSVEKSFCDKESLKRYGLMPSQKSNLTRPEVRAIAKYMFTHFTQKNLTKVQEEKAKYDALPQGRKIALKHKCFNCHRVNISITGPSFVSIAQKYEDDKAFIIKGIKNKSSRKWNKKSAAVMPAFKELSDYELEVLSEWILETKSL